MFGLCPDFVERLKGTSDFGLCSEPFPPSLDQTPQARHQIEDALPSALQGFHQDTRTKLKTLLDALARCKGPRGAISASRCIVLILGVFGCLGMPDLHGLPLSRKVLYGLPLPVLSATRREVSRPSGGRSRRKSARYCRCCGAHVYGPREPPRKTVPQAHHGSERSPEQSLHRTKSGR